MANNSLRADVLVSTDGGVNWRRHAGIIGSTDRAIERVRESDPALVKNTEAQFYAVPSQRFRRRRFDKQLIERYDLVDVADEDPPAKPIGEG